MHARLYFLILVLGVAFAGESRADGLLQSILDRGFVKIGYRTRTKETNKQYQKHLAGDERPGGCICL